MASPIITNAMPHHRRGEILYWRMSQQLIGTRTSTTRDKGKATERGIYFRTYSQIIRSRMIKTIANQISGEARPVIPVHDQLLERSALAFAPALSSNS